MQQKLKTQISIEMLPYIEPKMGERTWCQYECVPHKESWREIEGGFLKKILNPSLLFDMSID